MLSAFVTAFVASSYDPVVIRRFPAYMCTIGFFYIIYERCAAYRLEYDQLLEVHEGEACVADQICTLSSVEVGLELLLLSLGLHQADPCSSLLQLTNR